MSNVNEERRTRDKEYQDSNVYEATLDRIRHIYDSFDHVVVSFSGGKDSTVVLQCALEIAKERNKLPLKVVFIDEEAIHPPTIEYVERVRNWPEIDMDWYCLEFKHRNASSNEEPFWYTWDKDAEDRWVRPMPEWAITEHPDFKKGQTFQEWATYIYPKSMGRVAMLTGIRTEESLRRFSIIASKRNEPYMNSKSEGGRNQYRCFPIYDWSSRDVWIAVRKFDWDYNKTYDLLNMTKMNNNFLGQRVCPPFGEEPLRGIWFYAQCFPEMFEKMIHRVKGVATAWRYSNTELYSNSKEKPEDLTWRNYLDVIIDSYDEPYKSQVMQSINSYIKGKHLKYTMTPIKEEEIHPASGLSWQILCRVALRGDFKRRQANYINNQAVKRCKELGITIQQARKFY